VTIPWTIALALLALNGEPAPGDTRPEPAASRAPAGTRIDLAVLAAGGFVDRGELERAISLRLPDLTLVPLGAPTPADDGSLRALIELEHKATTVRLSLILSDGRAYLRELEVDADDAVRPTASALANLVAAIEDDTAVPDQQNVPLPAALAPAPAPAKPVPEDRPKPAPVTPPPAPLAPRWELGPSLRVGAAFGLSRPAALRGAGAAIGLDARAPSGLLLALDLQWLTRAVDVFHLQRVRVALGVGYALRRGGFELPVAALVGIEPWWLGRDGHRVPLRAAKAGPPDPLIGLGLRLSPGYSADIGKQGARLRVGARVELWASGQPESGLRRPELRLPTATAHLGGVELQLGLEVGVWLPVGRGVREPRTSRPHRSLRTGDGIGTAPNTSREPP
jgi:hypothetical protein